MEFAVIRFGGRQFKIKSGDTFEVARLVKSTDVDVLLYKNDENTLIGEPALSEVGVKLEKIQDKNARKIRIGRFKSKSRYRKVKGHKQPISIYKVTKLGNGVKNEVIEAVVEKSASKEAKVENKQVVETKKSEPKSTKEVKAKKVKKTEKKVEKETKTTKTKKSEKKVTDSKSTKKRGRPKKKEE